ncbi:hypothetical protein [Enterobacter asburiae]|uniref:hypothetical protein n=1 Tax=Enterobacter asburiae TaxID=61645 RepID=UPI003F575364
MGGGWLPQEDIREAGQYDLMKLGFMPLEENTAGDQTDTPFELWVPEVFGQVSRAAEQGHSNQYSLVPQFYRDVLDKMGQDGKISGEEIRRALTIRDPLVRDVVSRVVVKHHSEWFGGRSTGRWDGFYKTLGQLETGYCEKWQADLEWMSKVPPFNQDSAIWHMHPVVFLGAIAEEDGMDPKWLKVDKGQLTFDAEGNDQDASPWFSRKIHWPGGVSGVTIGRGYDLGQQASSEADLSLTGVANPLKAWLVGSQGLSASSAHARFNSASVEVHNSNITRKQQHDLFMLTYKRLEDDVKRICQKNSTIQSYHPNPQVSPNQAWDSIPEKIKEVLVDLRYRGDYTTHARSLLQHYAYTGDLHAFGQVLSNRSNWMNVPEDRFNRRVRFYES